MPSFFARFTLAALVCASAACAVGKGEGSVTGSLHLAGCDADLSHYDMQPDFFSASEAHGQLIIRIQPGGYYQNQYVPYQYGNQYFNGVPSISNYAYPSYINPGYQSYYPAQYPAYNYGTFNGYNTGFYGNQGWNGGWNNGINVYRGLSGYRIR